MQLQSSSQNLNYNKKAVAGLSGGKGENSC